MLTPRARARHVTSRSAPALAAYATVTVALLVVYLVTGTSELYVDGAPTPAERIVLTVIVFCLPLALLAGWMVARLESRRTRVAVAASAVAVAVVASVIQGGPSHLLGVAIVVAIVVASTATGVGAVLGWAVRLTVAQAAAMGDLFLRSLPVVLLTVVVFFNTYVWLMAATISQTRLWLAVLLLTAVTAAFVVSTSASRVRPMLSSLDGADDSHDLSGTPFAGVPDPPTVAPLNRAERVNVVVVLAAAQMAHLLIVAVCTSAIYFALGLIVLSPAVLQKWTGNGSTDGTVLGMTVPVPQSLLNMTLILCALTFMYVSARSVGDDEFKRDFLTPLIEDLHVTLIGRNRHHGDTGGGGN
ncbi:integral membrane protein [Mycolicibacterium sediminis]|uniref:Integral membrane protein n=1 Tax=Mycolicibacterium sediminis TaxID=1286180 RepID=A0A7I7QSZ6_9MYCO|nr:integral membrane protein [Mycolicibacterium sediminis]